MNSKILQTLAACAGLLFFRCECGNNTAGTITDTDTGIAGCRIVGLMEYRSGNAVNDASVDLHDQALVKRFVLAKTLASLLVRSGHTRTDINGFFEFDSVDTGGYLVAINDHDTLGGVFEATVSPGDTVVQVNGTLGKLGSVEGMVDDSLFSHGDSVQVYIPELDRWVSVDSLGYFFESGLPSYEYHIRVYVDGVYVPTPADTARVPVGEGDTTSIVNVGSATGSVIIDGRIREFP